MNQFSTPDFIKPLCTTNNELGEENNEVCFLFTL